ncbi:tyrosinase [Flagelloscypha sp. PMI_526]|nr:tyrosinase [Flagelloscypha sp. PMI_526]
MSHETDRIVISGASGGAAPRLEINELFKPENIKQYSLYIQAFAAFQKEIQDKPKSYFQVAGIHGLPAKAWDGAGSNQQAKGSQWPGYCFHSSTLFPTWHRPYIALFEQILNQHAVEIAKKYTTDTAAWAKAAQDLRAPYWDWAENIVPPSQVISDKRVKIAVAPHGTVQDFDNPLLRFTFHPLDKNYKFSDGAAVWKSTVRHPTKTTAPFNPDEAGNVNRLKETLKNSQISVRDKVNAMLFFAKTWPEFSNNHQNADGTIANSIEGVHNDIHNLIGGINPNNDVGGHMTDPSVAAFDPLFWLHHTNSQMNPDQWVTPDVTRRGTWSTAAGASLDESTALQPFSMSKTAYWPSSETRDVSRFNYYYIFATTEKGTISSLSSAEADSTQTSNDDLVAAILKKYHVRLSDKLISLSKSVPTHSHVDSQSPLPAETPGYIDWTVRVRVEKYAVNGSFLVLVFLGPVPTDPNDWLLSKSYVGSHAIFSRTAASIESCENCSDQRDSSIVVEGFVQLTSAFQEHEDFPTELGAESLQPDVVVPYLEKNLSWRVLGNKHVADIPSLEVGVFYAPITRPIGSNRPIQGTPVEAKLNLPVGGVQWE